MDDQGKTGTEPSHQVPALRHRVPALSRQGAVALGATAVGGLTLGALVMGAMAVGRLAIGQRGLGQLKPQKGPPNDPRGAWLTIEALRIVRIRQG